jgi:hypothetical protein
MKDATPYPVDLASEQKRFLEDMVTKHGLGDLGKAVRCLVNYAREHPQHEDVIFAEVRCLDC